MDNGSVRIPPRGISGWFAVFAFTICASFMKGVWELGLEMPDYLAGFRIAAARAPLIVVGLMGLATTTVHLWTIVALFQKKRALRPLYATLWTLMFMTPFALLPMLSVPGVTLDKILPRDEVAKAAFDLIVLGLWYRYLCVSVRVKNTLVD